MLAAKIKVLMLLIIGGTALVVMYWFFNKVRRSVRPSAHVHSEFTTPGGTVRKEILPNGMHVLVFKNTSLPKVLVQIAYDVGSYVEESGERGLAHLIEHMIYKGTTKLSESDIDAIARKYGASFNAFTSLDQTSYYFEVNKNNWKPFLPLLADCMQNARFDAQHLASEVKAVIQELKMGKDNYWRSMMLKAMELVFPANHPYHTPTIGFKEDLLNLDAENLKKFYKKYYRPDRATLFIVGDVDMDEAFALARENFASMKADKESVNKHFPVIMPELVTHHTRYFEDVNSEHLGFFWVIPGLKDKNELVASMLGEILGSGQSGRLYRLLVDEKKVATSVYAKPSQFIEAGIFLVLIEPIPGKAEECAELIRQELEHIVKDGVTALELERVAKNKSKNFFHKMQNFTEFVFSWIQSYFSTRDEMDIFQRADRYYHVTSSQVQAYTREYLDPFLMNRIEVLPLPSSKRGLRELIKRMSDELDLKILTRHARTQDVQPPKAVYGYQNPEPLTFSFPKPDRILELSNGLKVLLAANHNVPLITFNCQFKNASFLNEAREGIDLGFMMDMLMEGSKNFSKKELVDFFEQRGAAYSFDEHGARFSCLRQDFSELLERFNHILRAPVWPEDALYKKRDIFVDSYQRAKDSPKAMAVRILKNIVYKNHSYAWTFDEAIEDIKNIDSTALQTLHADFVSPANMIVSVVGDFDVTQMADVMQKALSDWQFGTKKTFAPAPSTSETNVKIDHHMLRDQVMFLLGQASPLTIYDADVIPLKMLNIISFDSLGSRIFKLREQTGLFYTAFGSFASHASREHGFDVVGMLVSLENVDKAEELTRQLLEDIAQHGVTAQELDAARQIYLKDLIDMVEDNTAIAGLMCSIDSLDLDFDYYDKVLARIQTITVEELNAIAARYFPTKAMSRVRVGPVAEMPEKVQPPLSA